MYSRYLRLFVAAVPLCLSGTAEAEDADTIDALATITAIQVLCRNVEVRPGYAFQYAEAHGLPVVDILPGGKRRPEFEAALAKASMGDHKELCSSVAEKYNSAMPGVIGSRP